VVEILPEVKAIIERQEAALQRIAMRIMEFPKEGRQEACRVARRSFEATVAHFRIDPEWGRNWITLTMERLRLLLIDMEADGGKGRA
jgi:hypothetical protein